MIENGIFPQDASEDWLATVLNRMFADDEFGRISLGEEKLEYILTETVDKASPECASIIRKTLRKGAPAMLRDQARMRRGFEKRLYQKWKKPLDLLLELLEITHELGDAFSKSYSIRAERDDRDSFFVLVQLHARACHVAREVHHLLTGGYSDGAHARWRTLHEISVVANFIHDKGDETARRYIDHDAVESFRAMEAYKEHCNTLGCVPLSAEEEKEIVQTYEQNCAKYGHSFQRQYGWATDSEGNGLRKFEDIEKQVSLDHLFPYYKLASHNVHANPKGILFRLGSTGDDILLAGASDTGLADPGHLAAISLLQTTVALLDEYPSSQGLMLYHVMKQICVEVGEAFLTIHQADEKQMYEKQ